MLSMDNIHLIKKLAAEGLSTRAIAGSTGFNRETVMKYINKKVAIPQPFPLRRGKKVDPYLPYLEALLRSDSAVTNPKLRLTAKRVHELLGTGQITDALPPLTLSIRSVERVVKDIRGRLAVDKGRRHLKLQHPAGNAQIDFGEVTMLGKDGETRHFILVMSLPHSNFRLAHTLPAQNFECLAHALAEMFHRIGRVPACIRCDNMSTAVAKVIRRDQLDQGQCNHDQLDHPRRLTDNFLAFKMAYGFDAEFCNPASGNEKGSVENAVGWVRRNFFCPLRSFDGDYDALNEQLAAFCLAEAAKPHYRHRPKTIRALLEEDLAAMRPLPERPADVTHSWSQATVSEDCRVQVDKNTYQIDRQPKTKVFVKRLWNKLAFYSESGELVSEHVRQYGSRKDTVDWDVELSMLSERPSAFNSSYLQSVCPQAVREYLRHLAAPKRAVLLRALRQRLSKAKDKSITNELRLLELAIEAYGAGTVEEVAAGYRGAEDVLTDSIKPMETVTRALGSMQMPPRDYAQACSVLGGYGHA